MSEEKWEGLRKKAIKLQAKIDGKLTSFSKLDAHQMSDVGNGSAAEPLLGNSLMEKTSQEIEALLDELSITTDEITSLLDLMPGKFNDHIAQRHREILREYNKEYNRMHSTMKQKQDKADLFSTRNETEKIKSSSGLNRRMELYLKENEHVRSSDRLLDEQISIAMETRESLSQQRLVFKRIRTIMNDLANRFPMMNSLLQRIHIKKRKDSIILGLVIGLCTFLLLAYAFW